MTKYAGETIQIRVAGTDFDQSTVLTDDEVTGMYVTIFDSAGLEALPLTAMAYDVDEAAWMYNWETTTNDAGSYRAKIEAFGQSATPQSYSLEFARIRLARRPVGD